MRNPASAIVACLLAASPAHAAPGGGAVPPPASLDARGIDAWRRAHIDGEGWTLMHADGAALSYARSASGSLAPDEDGLLRIDVRREYYKPVRLGRSASRSNYQSWLVDCGHRRLRVTAMNFYAQNNMKGSGFRQQGLEASWTIIAPETRDSPLFDRICASRTPARENP